MGELERRFAAQESMDHVGIAASSNSLVFLWQSRERPRHGLVHSWLRSLSDDDRPGPGRAIQHDLPIILWGGSALPKATRLVRHLAEYSTNQAQITGIPLCFEKATECYLLPPDRYSNLRRLS